MGHLRKIDYRRDYNARSLQQTDFITAIEIHESVKQGVVYTQPIIDAFGGTPERCFDQAFEVVAPQAFYNFYENNFDPDNLIITKPGGAKVKTIAETKDSLLHAIEMQATFICLANMSRDTEEMRHKAALKRCREGIPDVGLVEALNAFCKKQGNGIALVDAYVHAIHQVATDQKNTPKRKLLLN